MNKVDALSVAVGNTVEDLVDVFSVVVVWEVDDEVLVEVSGVNVDFFKVVLVVEAVVENMLVEEVFVVALN